MFSQVKGGVRARLIELLATLFSWGEGYGNGKRRNSMAISQSSSKSFTLCRGGGWGGENRRTLRKNKPSLTGGKRQIRDTKMSLQGWEKRRWVPREQREEVGSGFFLGGRKWENPKAIGWAGKIEKWSPRLLRM